MRNEDLIKLFFNSNNQFYWLHDLTGSILECSNSIERITGYTHAELLNQNPYDYFHPDDLDRIQNEAHQPVLDGKMIDIECRFRKADNTYMWMNTQGYPVKNEFDEIINIFSISTPITEIVSYRLEVQRKEQLMEQAGLMARIGAWEIDLTNNRTSWSKVTYAIFEVDESFQPTLENGIDFFSLEDGEVLTQHYERAINHGQAYDCVTRLNTAKGRKIWVRVIGKPEILYGKITKIFGVFQDIDKEVEVRKYYKDVISQLNAQKKQLLEFNQIISHNLRAPIGNFNLLLNMLSEEDDETEKQLIIKNLSDVSTSLHTLLDELVDVVKITTNSEVNYELLNLNNVLEHVKTLLIGDIKKLNAEINIDFEWNELVYPKMYLESIFLNMLSNSLKYASPLRPLKIDISSCNKDDKYGFLIFADNGSGIDMKRHAEKIFKLHKTFHKKVKGKGLGLFMTKNQIEATGGHITIDSQIDIGTKFIITLPYNAII